MKAKQQFHTGPDSWDKRLLSQPHLRPFPGHGSLNQDTTMSPSVAEWGGPTPREDVIKLWGRVELLWAPKA